MFDEIKIGVILWRAVEIDDNGDPSKVVQVEPRINDETGDFCYRIDMQSGSEPQLTHGHERGLTAICKYEAPEGWTHAVITAMSRNKGAAFIRFAHDENTLAYLAYRRALARELNTPELLGYQHMEPGFRRIQKPDMKEYYV